MNADKNRFEEFRNCGKQMVDYCCDYMKDIDKKMVSPVAIEPGFLAPQLPQEIPAHPESFKEVLQDLEQKIMPGCVHWNHPNFFAYFGNGNSYPSLLADMLQAALSCVGFSWSACPAFTELEAIVLDWYAKALDLPDFFLSKSSNPRSDGQGCIQSSASDAIYSAMNAARAKICHTLRCKNESVHESIYVPQLVCYASSQAHSSVEKAAKCNLVKFRAVEVDSHDCMRGEALLRAVEKDVAQGLTPFFVVATVGTTSQVAFDNLEEVAEVCKKYPTMWFHVDGAYGGNSFILPEQRHLMKGIEHIDSIDVNPNKLMMTAFDCTCLWIKDAKQFTDAFVIEPLYLQHEFNNDILDPRHFGNPLSRRFRALKLFFVMKMYGIKGMQDYVRRVIAAGKHFEKLVRSDDRFEIRNDNHCGLVCFRIVHDDAVNIEFLSRMNSSGRIHLTPAKARGKYIIRFVAGQEYANEQQVDNAWKIIKEFAEEIFSELKASPDNKLTPRMQRLDQKHTERFAYIRYVPKDVVEKLDPNQTLFDGATPISIISTGY